MEMEKGEEWKEGKCEKAEEIDQKKSSNCCPRLGCLGQCLGRYVWKEKYILWMSNRASSPDPDKNKKQTLVLGVFPDEFL